MFQNKFRDLILQAKKDNPSWGYRKIAKLVGCHHDSVRYNLSEARRAAMKASELSYRKSLKDQMVKAAGGKCSRCGYNKCAKALHFHHRDPSQKRNNISNLRKAAALNEVDKCDLLCANCHCEIHP